MNFQELSSFRVAVTRDKNLGRRDRVRAALRAVVNGLDLLAIVAGEKKSPLAKKIRSEATHYAAELARLCAVVALAALACGCGGAEFQSFPDDVDAGADVVDAEVLVDGGGRADAGELADVLEQHKDAPAPPVDAGLVDAPAPPMLDANVPPAVCCNLSPPSSMFAGCPWTCYADASTCDECPLGAVCRWVDPNTGDGWLGKVTPCP